MSKKIAQAEARRVAAGLLIEDLCQRVGIAESTWWRWKTGQSQPRLATWEKVERVLDEIGSET